MEKTQAIVKIPEDTQDESLEQRIENPVSDSNGLILSEKQFLEFVALADSLRQYDKNIGASELERVKKDYLSEIPLEAAIKTARGLGIDKQYVSRAKEILFPSKETQLEDILKIKAIPSENIIKTTYINEMLAQLRKSLPNYCFSVEKNGGHGCPFYLNRIITYKKEIGIFKKKIKEYTLSEEWASLHMSCLTFNDINLHICIKNPILANVCSNTINKVSNRFVKEGIRFHWYNIKYDYVVK